MKHYTALVLCVATWPSASERVCLVCRDSKNKNEGDIQVLERSQLPQVFQHILVIVLFDVDAPPVPLQSPCCAVLLRVTAPSAPREGNGGTMVISTPSIGTRDVQNTRSALARSRSE